MRWIVGHVPVTGVVVRDGGVDAAVVGPSLVQEVRVRIGEVSAAPNSFSPRPSVEPALVAVAAGGVTGQSVAAGVTGVLSLPLQGKQGQESALEVKRR